MPTSLLPLVKMASSSMSSSPPNPKTCWVALLATMVSASSVPSHLPPSQVMSDHHAVGDARRRDAPLAGQSRHGGRQQTYGGSSEGETEGRAAERDHGSAFMSVLCRCCVDVDTPAVPPLVRRTPKSDGLLARQ
jgi:hypothetical protein